MDSWIAVIVFVTVAAITPGPNNFIVMAAGARDGLVATAPLIAGVLGGGLVLVILASTGVAILIQGEPRLLAALTIAGAAYLSWLGGGMIWRTRRTVSDTGEAVLSGSSLPQTGLGIAAFQFLNPKAWIAVVTATAAVSRDTESVHAAVVLGAIFVVLPGICLTLWAFAGSAIGRFVSDGRSKRWFDRTMGGLLMLSAALLLS